MPEIPEEKIEKIYEGSLEYEDIVSEPILKPVAEINEIYYNFDLIARRAMVEYQRELETLNKMTKDVPKYLETTLFNQVQNMINLMKDIIHAKNIQNNSLKKSLREIIKIVRNRYVFYGKPEAKKEEFFLDSSSLEIPTEPKEIEKEEEKPKEEIKPKKEAYEEKIEGKKRRGRPRKEKLEKEEFKKTVLEVKDTKKETIIHCIYCKEEVKLLESKKRIYEYKDKGKRYNLYGKCSVCGRRISTFISKDKYAEI